MRTDDGDETAAEARKKEHAAQKDALVKELFRVTAANGRVTYTVIFKNGEVVKV